MQGRGGVGCGTLCESYNLNTTKPIITKFLQGIAPSVGIRGCPTTSPNKSKVANGGHIEFHKMLISPYSIKLFAHNLEQRCNTGQTTDNNCKTAFSLYSVEYTRHCTDDYNF